MEDKKNPTEPRKKVKCAFSLPRELVDLLRAKTKETGHGQSKIAVAVFQHGLPFYTVDGVKDPNYLLPKPVTTALEKPLVTASADQPSAEDLVPDPATMDIPSKPRPMPAHTTQPSRTPSFVNQVSVTQPGQVPGQTVLPPPSPEVPGPGYIPNMNPRGADGQPDPRIEMPVLDPQLVLMFQHFMAQMQAGTSPQPQQPVQPEQQQVYNPMPPPPPPQFAASYPPGYTGPPSVAPVVQPAQEQPMYPVPGQEAQAPAYMRDQFAMNMGAGASSGPTAQSLLSGGNMAPNVMGPNSNINMQAASSALGPDWRSQFRRIAAQDRRE